AGGELDPPGLQVVEDHRLDAVVEAGGGDRAADVPGATGDEDLHSTPPAEAPVRETVSAGSMVRDPFPLPQVSAESRGSRVVTAPARGRSRSVRADGPGRATVA